MAKFGSDVTGMSQADTVAARRVFEGVVDKSSAIETAATTGLIESAGKMGIDAYHGYQLAEVEKENLDVVKEAETGILAKSIFKLPLAEEELDPVLKAYGFSTKKYVNALQQGIMTPTEFETRTAENLRRAVNKNPGMRDELVNHTRETLELTGMASALKQEALTQKHIKDEQDNYIKQINTKLLEYKAVVSPDTPIYIQQKMLQGLMDDEKAFQTILKYKEIKEKITDEQAYAYMESSGWGAVRGGLTNWNQKLQNFSLDVQGKPQTFDQMKAAVIAAAPIQKELFREAIDVRIRQHPEIKKQIDEYEKAIDTSVIAYIESSSGENGMKAAQNLLDITKITQEQSFRNKYNVPVMDMAIRALAASPGVAASAMQREGFVTSMAALITDDWRAPIIDKNLPKNMNDNNLSRYIDSTAKIGKEDGNYEGLNKILDSYNKKTGTITDPTQKYIFLSKNLESLSKADLEGIDTNTVSQVNTMINNYLTDPQYGLKGMFDNVNKYGATIDILDDGRAIFIKENAQIFNEKYGISLNTALKAYANVRNITTKEAAKTFYPEYFDKYVTKTVKE